MMTSYRQAADGSLPDKLPSEIYCHTLTDESILSPELYAKGYPYLDSLSGWIAPWTLFAQNNAVMRDEGRRQGSSKG